MKISTLAASLVLISTGVAHADSGEMLGWAFPPDQLTVFDGYRLPVQIQPHTVSTVGRASVASR